MSRMHTAPQTPAARNETTELRARRLFRVHVERLGIELARKLTISSAESLGAAIQRRRP
jgi:hypothetical protein